MMSILSGFSAWQKELPPLQRLLVSFMMNWSYWLMCWLVFIGYFGSESHTWKYYAGFSIWMGFFVTITNNWNLIVQLVKAK